MNNKKNQFGSTLVMTLVIIGVGLILINIIADFALVNLRLGNNYSKRATSREIAEAGINYYQWHLSHNNKDYRDGHSEIEYPTAPFGPFVHIYKNANGETIGQYSLIINPPNANSPYVTVTSEGKANNDSRSITIEATIGIPSYSHYSWVSDEELYFGQGATTFGKIHSNQGIRFDGTAMDLLTSAKLTYEYGCNENSKTTKEGIWTSIPPGDFRGGIQFPVPAVDFTQITADFQNLKNEAQKSEGLYLPATSGYKGYQLIIQSNPNQIELRYVRNSTNQNKLDTTEYETVPYPQNGIIFVEDNAYISGVVNARLTIAVATLPDPKTKKDQKGVTIVNDIIYHNNIKDGSIVLGIIAQNNIEIAKYVDKNLDLYGALLSQNGGVGFDYNAFNANLDLGILNTYGGIASDVGTCGGFGMSGYNKKGDIIGFSQRNYYYDQNLLLNPPPLYPTTGSYTIISWREK